MSEWKFYIETYGCKVNQHESQQLREAWEKLGGKETENPGDADYICVNSCAITAKAESDARNALARLKRENSSAFSVLTGCAAQLFIDKEGKKNLSAADLIVPQKNKTLLLNGPQLKTPNQDFPPKTILNYYKRARPVIKIQDGCRQNCAFCIVPKTRGLPSSRDYKDIARECHSLVNNGHVELVLSGINLREYIEPEAKLNFWQTLEKLDSGLYRVYGEKIRLRLSSLEPTMLNSEALTVLKNCHLVVPHLHISLQHGSEKVLREMGRGDTRPAEILDFIAELAKFWPVAAIGADILAGFPGEDDNDMFLLMDLLKKLPLTYAHVFPYSRRPGTRAHKFENQVSQLDKTRRAAHLRQLVHEKAQTFRKKLLQLPQFSIVLDLPCKEEAVLRGVNEFYVPCFLRTRNYSRELLAVKPVGLNKNGILVEAI